MTASDSTGPKPDQQRGSAERIGHGPVSRLGIECPHCGCPESAVIDSRLREMQIGSRRIVTRIRRRACDHCDRRFTTREELAGAS